MKRILKTIGKPVESINTDDIRRYLYTRYQHLRPSSYGNDLKALKRFFRDYLKRPHLVESFKFPRTPFKPKTIPSRHDLISFYHALPTIKDQALFLIYATSGLRRMEILSLTQEEIDLQKRMIIPSNHQTNSTKNTWISFFNAEAQHDLEQYLNTRSDRYDRLFPMAKSTISRIWKPTRIKTGLNITPQRLREWFCIEMAELGVQDRFIDAFCGRTPKSILARHYTDYSPHRLKKIYDNANLRVLS
jgi:integrase